ncbi:MAG TPA: AAA family ATPase [Ilumatobacteraceae bacterium]|nr:AAA family ATPase [Ilumatobacteraceae bacterium]
MCGAKIRLPDDGEPESALGVRRFASSTQEIGPQRRRLTVLFADLSGFTTLTQQYEPEDVRLLVDSFLGIAREAVETWGGRVDQFLGDGVLAVFGDPVAREDDAERAVRAAVDISSATRDLRLPGARSGPPQTSHIGVATGMAVTADASNDLGVTAPMGTVVNLAARLESLAGADEILVCATTAHLVRRVATMAPLGDREIKGIDQPVEVHRVVEFHRADPIVAGLSSLVGRARELETLSAGIESLVVDGKGGAVVVLGEAGAGKSRLFHEIQHASSRDGSSTVTWLEGRGRSTGVSTPYAPIIEVIESVAGIEEHHDERELRRRLGELVERLDLSGDDVLGTLHRLFAVEDSDEASRDREGYQARLGHAIEALLTAASRRAPTVVCVQDLHWVDPSTITMLRSIVPALRCDILFLFNSRPVDTASIIDGCTEIRLGDLDVASTGELIESRLGAAADEALIAMVAERSGGNAFFAEEVLNRLVEEESLEVRGGCWVLRSNARQDDVPSTVQGVIAARLDALPFAARTQLRHAAVFGRDFTTDDLRSLEPDIDPTEALDVLVRADIIRPVGDADAADRYDFKHALTFDVVRSSLTKTERRRLHRAAAISIESRMTGRTIELADVLGEHYHLAGEVEPAVRHLGIAAQRALDRYAINEADQLYRIAYEMLIGEAGDDERQRHLGSLLIGWVLVHYYRGTWRDATDLLALHDDDIDANGDARVVGMALAWRGFSAAIAQASINEALDLLDRAIEVGERADDPEVLAHAHTWRVWAQFLCGNHAEALADGERVDELLGRLVDRRYVSIKSAGAIGLAEIGLGRFANARRTADWLIATGAQTGSTRATSMGQSVLSLVATVTGDIEASAAFGREAVATATDPIYRDFARVMGVHGLVAAGVVDEARAMHDDLVDSCTTLGLDGLILAAAPACGVMNVLAGDLTGGMSELDDAIDRAERAGSPLLASFGRVYRASVRARAVTREVSVPLTIVLRNPRFVTRHALPARRRGVDELEQLIIDLPTQGGAGLRWLVSIELAKLLAVRGDRPRAEAVIARAASWMPDAPATSLDDVLGVFGAT